MFVTPVLKATPDASPASTRRVHASSKARRSLDLTSPSPEKLSDENIKTGTFVTGISGDREGDIGVIMAVKDGACSVIWQSDAKQDEAKPEELALFTKPNSTT